MSSNILFNVKMNIKEKRVYIESINYVNELFCLNRCLIEQQLLLKIF